VYLVGGGTLGTRGLPRPGRGLYAGRGLDLVSLESCSGVPKNEASPREKKIKRGKGAFPDLGCCKESDIETSRTVAAIRFHRGELQGFPTRRGELEGEFGLYQEV